MFKAYLDPGHGWVAVKVRLLEDLRIADKITRCSFLKGKTAYLEEDCDLATFIDAYVLAFGFKPHFDEKCSNKSSPIRSYPRYSYTKS
jgi:hypothetical protein